MTKYLYTIFFLAAIFTNEVAMDMFSNEDCNLCIVDSPIENESEKETKENSKEESKIEIFPGDLSFHYEDLYAKSEYLIKYHFTIPSLDIFTPPPEHS